MILIVLYNGELLSSQPISFSYFDPLMIHNHFFLCQDVPPESASSFLSSRNQVKMGFGEVRKLIPVFNMCLWDLWVFLSHMGIQIIMIHDFHVFCCSLSCLLTKKVPTEAAFALLSSQPKSDQ